MISQTQPTPDSCVVTCCAMLSKLPATQLREKFHNQLWDRSIDARDILRELDVKFKEVFYEGPVLFKGFVYLAIVPSLNTPGEFHQIILDCRGDDPVVLDPARGYGEKLYYAWNPEKGECALAVPLTSWLNELEVTPHD